MTSGLQILLANTMRVFLCAPEPGGAIGFALINTASRWSAPVHEAKDFFEKIIDPVCYVSSKFQTVFSIMSLFQSLIDWFQPFSSCVVAFSGGLDSSVVAKAAALALGDHAEAVLAYSPSSLQDEVDDARAVAEAIPIRFQAFPSFEMDDEAYIANDRDRCFYCKKIRFGDISRYAAERGSQVVVDGSNADDLDDYRPGRRAVLEFGIRSPLAELGITKAQVREIARLWNLPNSEKPATPCLSTRLAYGLQITEERLRRIEAAEEFLRTRGFTSLRVRMHADELARIEVSSNEISRLAESELRSEIVEEFQRLGFRFVSVDLSGFRSGSMNVGEINNSRKGGGTPPD